MGGERLSLPPKEAREKEWEIMGDNYQNLKQKGGNLKQFMSNNPHLFDKFTAMRKRKRETV